MRTLCHCDLIASVPWRWKRGDSRKILREKLAQRFQGEATLFATGREALCALLRSLDLKSGEEVMVQGYTCVVVPNAIHAAGGVPVYVDIDRDTLNLDPEAVEATITNRTRAVICQHTFGIPAETQRLKEICNKHNLILIEDCAHVIPDRNDPEAIAKYGDFLLFSLGRDKAISGITGGVLISRKPEASAKLKDEEKNSTDLSFWKIGRLINYPWIYYFARPFYGIVLGKAFLVLTRKIGLLVPILSDDEKEDGKMPLLLHRLPNACAYLALQSFKRLSEINDHRRTLTRFYLEEGRKNGWPLLSGVTENLPLQKFPLFVRNADGIRAKLKKKNIHLNDGWTGCVVCPPGINLDALNYTPGSDPEAEAACEQILSLPTHPTMTMRQAKILVQTLDLLLKGR